MPAAHAADQWSHPEQPELRQLAAWYSDRYNGLGEHHTAKIARAKSDEHNVIVYCKLHPEMKIIQAIDVIFER